jgi:hypothetical protein
VGATFDTRDARSVLLGVGNGEEQEERRVLILAGGSMGQSVEASSNIEGKEGDSVEASSSEFEGRDSCRKIRRPKELPMN